MCACIGKGTMWRMLRHCRRLVNRHRMMMGILLLLYTLGTILRFVCCYWVLLVSFYICACISEGTKRKRVMKIFLQG